MIEDRVQLVRSLHDQIAALKDVSEEAELAFASKTIGRFQQLGGKPEAAEVVDSRIAQEFDKRRNADLLAALEKEAAVYGKTRQELALLSLAENNATASEVARVKGLYDKIAAIDAAKDAERAAVAAAQAAARDAERQRERTLHEGQALKQALRTPEEKQRDEIANINRLRQSGAIDDETRARAINRAMQPAQDAERRVRSQIAAAAPLQNLEFGSSTMQREFETYKTLRTPADAMNRAGVPVEAKPLVGIAAADKAGAAAMASKTEGDKTSTLEKALATLTVSVDRNSDVRQREFRPVKLGKL